MLCHLQYYNQILNLIGVSAFYFLCACSLYVGVFLLFFLPFFDRAQYNARSRSLDV